MPKNRPSKKSYRKNPIERSKPPHTPSTNKKILPKNSTEKSNTSCITTFLPLGRQRSVCEEIDYQRFFERALQYSPLFNNSIKSTYLGRRLNWNWKGNGVRKITSHYLLEYASKKYHMRVTTDLYNSNWYISIRAKTFQITLTFHINNTENNRLHLYVLGLTSDKNNYDESKKYYYHKFCIEYEEKKISFTLKEKKKETEPIPKNIDFKEVNTLKDELLNDLTIFFNYKIELIIPLTIEMTQNAYNVFKNFYSINIDRIGGLQKVSGKPYSKNSFGWDRTMRKYRSKYLKYKKKYINLKMKLA